MPKVSEEHLEARRQQIVDAAVQCFARSGIHGTSLDDIRLEADLSRGAVYHYFKSKEDIIDALRERSVSEDADLYSDSAQGLCMSNQISSRRRFLHSPLLLI